MTILTCKIDGVEKDASMITTTEAHPSDAPDMALIDLPIKETVSHGDPVEIFRDGTKIFKGILELDTPQMSPSGVVMQIKARQEKVRIWRNFIERNEDPLAGGFWGGQSDLTGPAYYYPNKIIEFYLHPSKSDDVAIGIQHRTGWGIRPDNWVVYATATGAGYSRNSVRDRLNTIVWNSGKTQAAGDYLQIDLGSAKNICAIRVENRKDNNYIRHYRILIGTSSPPTTEVASKSNNAAHNIVESWSPQSARYVRIYCTTPYALATWTISEIYIYESKGELSGISVGQLDEHAPLNEAIDLPWIRRTEAIEAIVGLTETSYVPWEFWVEDDGKAYFKNRRGSDKSLTVSFVYGTNLERDKYKRDSMKKGERVKVLGKGKGHEQDLVASDWVGSGAYEKLEIDRKLETKEACTAKANIIHNTSQSPIETITCQVTDNYPTGTWGVGDDITLTNSKTGLSGSYRVKRVVRKWSGQGEVVTITATSSWLSLVEYHSRMRGHIRIIQQQDDRYSKDSERKIEKIDPTKIYPTGQYTRYYEAEEILPTWASDGNTLIVDDSDATEGICIRRASGTPNATMWAGPYVSLDAGSYYALFRVKVTSNASSSNILRLDVYSSALGGILGQFQLTPDRFPASNTFHTFGVAFELQSNVSDLQLRGMDFRNVITNFFFDWVGIVTRDTPIATAGVTLSTHSGTDTDPHSGTNTDEHQDTDANPHGGTDAAINYMPASVIEPYPSWGSYYSVYTDKAYKINPLQYTGTTSDAIDLAYVEIQLQRESGSGNIKLILQTSTASGCNVDLVTVFMCTLYMSGQYMPEGWTAITLPFITPMDLRNKVMCLLAWKDGSGSVSMRGRVKVTQFRKHDHTMSDPNDHIITQPKDHIITDPTEHIVTDPDPHTTESDHEH